MVRIDVNELKKTGNAVWITGNELRKTENAARKTENPLRMIGTYQ
jgi:hypothetical protein